MLRYCFRLLPPSSPLLNDGAAGAAYEPDDCAGGYTGLPGGEGMTSPVPSDAVAAPLSCGAGTPRAPLLARLPGTSQRIPWRKLARALRRAPIIHASAPRAVRRRGPRRRIPTPGGCPQDWNTF